MADYLKASGGDADLLRVATAGSVDDGKSTLVGRLLYDSRSVLSDQLAAIGARSPVNGQDGPDLALLTDGLRAEREQGITIDVAYRYFATASRRFVLADNPGHVQYTRNMVTGSSTAQVTVVLIDARKGVVEQTRRHTAVAALLRVPRVVAAVNKMDLVDWDEQTFARTAQAFAECADRLGVPEVATIPVSALRGDNVIAPSAHTDWYGGPTLLEYLESVPVGDTDVAQAARLPVQCTLTADDGRQLPAGQLVAGTLRVGEPVAVLPAGRTSVIESIDVLGRPATVATAPQSVTVRLADPVDVHRGDLIAPLASSPLVRRHLTPTLCVLTGGGLRAGDRYLIRHGTQIVDATVTRLVDRLDLATLRRVTGPEVLQVNDIGRVALELDRPLPLDDYPQYRRTGSFLVIDKSRGDTIAAGMTG
ncbi:MULTISPECIES: sulfate adenylyltransferase subunit 1 [unclassified Solwaraspora]|uniref:sulfate adenylyltransferase subunit 1 n=1 Tax=unclassified Solwaraspora TaxID=2627926 RepID=UPI00259B6E5D|nr:GTP-binding protein [Solwaraspora sp. WMMA2056]WJK38706.1 GTP-binding protein [Solwaraspora sp. WMMA2056]